MPILTDFRPFSPPHAPSSTIQSTSLSPWPQLFATVRRVPRSQGYGGKRWEGSEAKRAAAGDSRYCTYIHGSSQFLQASDGIVPGAILYVVALGESKWGVAQAVEPVRNARDLGFGVRMGFTGCEGACQHGDVRSRAVDVI
jgi:hypothetical protein